VGAESANGAALQSYGGCRQEHPTEDGVTYTPQSLMAATGELTRGEAWLEFNAVNQTARLSWTAQPGTRYEVLASDSLDDVFAPVAEVAVTEGDEAAVQFPVTSAMKFFKIRAK
jgi:hypothetical protein